MSIVYTSDLARVGEEDLSGFFVGWPNPPDAETLLRVLRGSQQVVLAKDGRRVVGFATALTDGVLTAFVPLLEVLPEYQGRGVGRELVRRVVQELGEIYAIDLVCDDELKPFYGELGFVPMTAMSKRNYSVQCGKPERATSPRRT